MMEDHDFLRDVRLESIISIRERRKLISHFFRWWLILDHQDQTLSYDDVPRDWMSVDLGISSIAPNVISYGRFSCRTTPHVLAH
jgi:hypothetical protein